MLSLRPWLFGGTFQLEVGFAMGFANLARPAEFRASS
jgi:hypothetical protein